MKIHFVKEGWKVGSIHCCNKGFSCAHLLIERPWINYCLFIHSSVSEVFKRCNFSLNKQCDAK